MSKDINDILGITNPPEQKNSKRQIVENLISDLVFSLGQGYSASGRGPQGRSAGIGAALQGPMVRQQILQQQQNDAQARQLEMVKARELMRQGRNREALELLQIRTQLPEETTMTPPPAPTEPVIEGTPETGLRVKSLGTPTYAPTRPEMYTPQSGQQVPLYPPSAGAQRQAQDAADARKAALDLVEKQNTAATRETPAAPTIDTPAGRMQWNPQTQRYDIKASEKLPETAKYLTSYVNDKDQHVEVYMGADNKPFERVGQKARAPQTNPYLNELRQLNIQNLKDAAPGQIVYTKSGLPVPTSQVGNEASQKLADYQTLFQQAEVVKGILDKLGPTGAIKGWVLKEGIYLPVVQDNITKDQAEAVSELQRLANAYIYAVSGKQINEQEMARISRTTPQLTYTKDTNDVILKNFLRYAESGRDNYLKLRGWKIKDAAAPDTGTGTTKPAAKPGWSILNP